jgi:hypothetical protein
MKEEDVKSKYLSYWKFFLFVIGMRDLNEGKSSIKTPKDEEI